MILMGPSLCLPSAATVQELFTVARDAGIIPDISLDPVLTTFLSLDSSAALQHQYTVLQRSMSREQQTAFNLNLTTDCGGSRISHGGVGVVALALSMLFDQVAQQIRAKGVTEGNPSSQRIQSRRIFGISSTSNIGWIIQSYLQLVPGIANNPERMAETTELYDKWLKLEMIDHYERMTTKKRMSSVSMQQWLVGAAFHLHMRIHQVRIRSVPFGSVEALRLSYRTGLAHLFQGYKVYLRKNIQVTAVPQPQTFRSGTEDGLKNTTANMFQMNMTFSNNVSLLNSSRLTGPHDENATFSSTGTERPPTGRNESVKTVSIKTYNDSTGYKEPRMQGLLVIEPLRNVSHRVPYHPCESPAIEQALAAHIFNAQDVERNKNFFFYSEKVLYSLLRQRNYFELRTG